ncbi:acetylglutamate kinase [Streptococcus sobrinus]|uniref:Acetylglutamate kinase n=3 Tax=Streptococcus sobrinus TaxID=1310 RepID=U2KHJ9_9STRE|nr:acetylglutamate kinase [Streptococcus sobrinus]AWN21166.1 acetylglutamate kinase [Streptococcus sobrinus]EMP71019.1 acetylglutamate kinase [Streptococcus sobrinus DSM 20742 = ATCC 33478]ERJ76644.1 acetylglutamate kinase [Streptococcus sobrinus W1703]SQG13958.1 acetylglutamate kinase [Streptococcus sobrinus]
MSDTIVIKIGGRASQHLSQEFLEQVEAWQAQEKSLVIVHGGGYAINQLMEAAQIPVKKIDGLRVTDQESLKLVQQALIEIVGKTIHASLTQAGLPSQQLVDQLPDLVEAQFLDQSKYGYVGHVSQIHEQVLAPLLEQGVIPLIPSLGYQDGQTLLNINADYLATGLAVALQAEKLILMTDVPGVKENGQVLSRLKIGEIPEKIEQGIITGGMVPKLKSAAQTVRAGVKQVLIGDNLTSGSLIEA